jgi:hypothetical protein
VAELRGMRTIDLYGMSTACSYLIRSDVLSDSAASELQALSDDIVDELEKR